MDNQSYNQELSILIKNDFKIEDASLIVSNREEEIFSNLRKIVAQLLDHDMEKLLQILYRVDVSESKVKRILSLSDPEHLCNELTHAIIDRMKQKLYYRSKYS